MNKNELHNRPSLPKNATQENSLAIFNAKPPDLSLIEELEASLELNSSENLNGTEKPVKLTIDHEDVQKNGRGELDLLGIYIGEIAQTPLLKHAEELEFGRKVQAGLQAEKELELEDLSEDERGKLLKIQAEGKVAAADFTRANLRLAVSVAKRYIGKGVSFPDLIQEGNLGIIRAVNKYDPEKGYRFSTYATWWVRQAITRALADKSRTIRIPVHMSAALFKLRKITEEFVIENGEEPDRETLRRLFLQNNGSANTTFESVLAVLQGKISQPPMSLDKPIHGRDGDETLLGDLIKDNRGGIEEQVIEEIDNSELSRLASERLTKREWEIIQRRFGFGENQAETLAQIGGVIGVSRERVRQIENESLSKLRSPFTRAGYKKEFSDKSGQPRLNPQNSPPVPMHSNGNSEYVKKQPEVLKDTLSNRARQILGSESCPEDPQSITILTLVSDSDKESFPRVKQQIGELLDITEDQAFNMIMRLIDNSTKKEPRS